MAMNRVALGIEYNGSRYVGWQSQASGDTVQQRVEDAVSRVADARVTVHCAGRTDTGVHALNQVAHFDTDADRSERQWLLGINSNLPADVCVRWVRPVPLDFHARFSALSRSYRYVIDNRWVRPAIGHELVTGIREPLDERRMHEAAQALLGEHDFTAFRAAGCQAAHAVRTVRQCVVARQQHEVTIAIEANGFLYHMVRNIVGSLLPIGRGEQPAEWLTELLAGRDRERGGVAAPASGLYFETARYPEAYALPLTPPSFPRGEDLS